jgi:hypothetical protein
MSVQAGKTKANTKPQRHLEQQREEILNHHGHSLLFSTFFVTLWLRVGSCLFKG